MCVLLVGNREKKTLLTLRKLLCRTWLPKRVDFIFGFVWLFLNVICLFTTDVNEWDFGLCVHRWMWTVESHSVKKIRSIVFFLNTIHYINWCFGHLFLAEKSYEQYTILLLLNINIATPVKQLSFLHHCLLNVCMCQRELSTITYSIFWSWFLL